MRTGRPGPIERIAEAFDCRTQTVEKLRQRFVSEGFERRSTASRASKPPTEKLLDGEQEAKVIAMRLGPPPQGLCQLDAAVAGPQGRGVGDRRVDQP